MCVAAAGARLVSDFTLASWYGLPGAVTTAGDELECAGKCAFAARGSTGSGRSPASAPQLHLPVATALAPAHAPLGCRQYGAGLLNKQRRTSGGTSVSALRGGRIKRL